MKLTLLFCAIVFLMFLLSAFPILTGKSRPLPGDPKNFDPFLIRKDLGNFLGTSTFAVHSFRGNNLSSSGTYNLKNKTAQPLELIVGLVGGSHPSVGEGKVEAYRITFFRPTLTREISRGGGIATDFSFFYLGMTKERLSLDLKPKELIPWPECSLKDLWQKIQSLEPMSSNTTIDIKYSQKGFEVTVRSSRTKKYLLSADCKLLGE